MAASEKSRAVPVRSVRARHDGCVRIQGGVAAPPVVRLVAARVAGAPGARDGGGGRRRRRRRCAPAAAEPGEPAHGWTAAPGARRRPTTPRRPAALLPALASVVDKMPRRLTATGGGSAGTSASGGGARRTSPRWSRPPALSQCCAACRLPAPASGSERGAANARRRHSWHPGRRRRSGRGRPGGSRSSSTGAGTSLCVDTGKRENWYSCRLLVG